MDKSQEMLGTESIGKLLIKYSIPAIIGMLVNSLYNIIARIFIANIPGVGPLAITGVGVTMPVTTIILAFAVLVGIGAATNISIKLGQGKKEEAEQILGNTLTLSVIIGIILTIVGLLFADSILGLFGASEGSLPYAKAYVNVLLLGTACAVLSLSLSHMIRVDGNPRLSATIMVVACIIDVILVFLFINVLDMGIKGAALATVICQTFSVIWGLSYFFRGKSNLKFRFSSLKLKTESVKSIVVIGTAPFVIQIAASLVQVISNNALKTYGGDLAIGAMATIFSIMMVFLMPIFGITQGAQPIIGYNYGAKNYNRAKETYKISVIISTIMLIIGWLVIQFAPEVLVSLFGKDKELMDITVNGIKKYSFALPIVAISIVGSTYVQAVGKPKKSMMLSLLRQVILLIPMIIILPRFLQLDGVWIAQAVADLVATIITAIVIRKEFSSYKDEKVQIEKEKVNKGETYINSCPKSSV
jgi:putative MATE family efflux protein